MTSKKTDAQGAKPDAQEDPPEVAPESDQGRHSDYDDGYAAFGPGGTIIAFGADVERASAEAAAAGHADAFLLPALRRKPAEGDQ